MSESELLVLKNRYQLLVNAQQTSATDFSKYLVSTGLITADMAAGYVHFKKTEQSSIPMDNSVTLHTFRRGKGKYFSPGDSIRIGSNGKRKSKYYKRAIQLTGEAKCLISEDTQTLFAGYAEYYESFSFASDESAELYMRFDKPMMVIRKE